MYILACWLLLTVAASANWSKNLNYRSPSEHHPGLGISIHKVAKRNVNTSPWDPAQLNFTHGVASGDPYPDSVILWTRAAPTADDDPSNVTVSGFVPLYDHSTDVYVNASKSPVCVSYVVSEAQDLSSPVTSGVCAGYMLLDMEMALADFA